MEPRLEYCFLCYEPTGKSGPGDGSIYDDAGEGPYCEDCWSIKSDRAELAALRAEISALRARAEAAEGLAKALRRIEIGWPEGAPDVIAHHALAAYRAATKDVPCSSGSSVSTVTSSAATTGADTESCGSAPIASTAASHAADSPAPRAAIDLRPHRWSGWPGAYCLACGCEDPVETAMANGFSPACPGHGTGEGRAE